MDSYGIGLDIGISSVGWAVVALDKDESPFGIINMGSRVFDVAENPKNGASLALPRRTARSMRRRLRRHRHRNERIREMIVSRGILSEAELERLFDGRLEDIYALRVRALDERVSAAEFARILIHISQRRGFRSNRKSGTSKEDGELLSAVSENAELMKSEGYRTVGELFLKCGKYSEYKRNKGGKYIATVGRDMVADEVKMIFAAQRSFGAPFAAAGIEEEYLEILLSQRSFDEGPGSGPYAGSQIERMIGACTLEKNEKRAAKASYSFEYFNLLTHVNSIRIADGGESAPLSGEQRKQLIELAHKTEALDFSKIRKALALGPGKTFNLVYYRPGEEQEAAEKKQKFSYLKAYHEMRRGFDKISKGHISGMSREKLNAIGYALTVYKTEKKIREALGDIGLTPEELDAAASLGNFSGFGNLSVKACEKLIPHLEAGLRYDEACTAAGYDFRAHGSENRQKLLHLTEEALEPVTSPVVRRAVSQTVKVINAIIRDRGCSPTFINVELAREMSKDINERNRLKKEMDDNARRNERAMDQIKEFGVSHPTGQDLLKYLLWQEQDGRCAYSLSPIPVSRLFEDGYCEIDHIIPYSLSFDDSRKNKVLVLSRENQIKGNRLPLQYMTGEQRDNFVVWVNASVRNIKKRNNLLKESFTAEEAEKFRERNLQDTKTMSRFILNYLNDNLEFAPSQRRKKRVTAVNGIITSYLRKRWGINKVRANGDLHHAVDALVIACTTDGMIQRLSRYSELRECRYMHTPEASIAVDPATGEVISTFPYPWPKFRDELEGRLSSDPMKNLQGLGLPLYGREGVPLRPLFVSRMPRRKVTGAAHLETIKSPAALGEGLLVSKQPLTRLRLDKDGEIANYYMPQSDRLLYEALKAQLAKFGGSGERAFAEPFRKPKSDGTPGPIVNKVKLCEKATLSVPVLDGKGAADNDSMVRIDVFFVENDGYYFVPVYVSDTIRSELPDRACVHSKPYSEWKRMDDRNFVFSLYPNDLIRVTGKKGLKLRLTNAESTLPPSYETKSEFLYYKGADISTASIIGISHDGAYKVKGLGIKTLVRLEKYTVDVLGNYSRVGKETRQGFNIKIG